MQNRIRIAFLVFSIAAALSCQMKVAFAAGGTPLGDSPPIVIVKDNLPSVAADEPRQPCGIISTYAGTGDAGFSGDEGPATAADLNEPEGVAVGPNGDLIIVDTHNHRIRKVDAKTGIISTVAGTGGSSFSGDDGLATAATLNLPSAVAIDGDGNIFIADTYNSTIRKIDGQTGTISRYTSHGQGFWGDNGPAISARLNRPEGLAFDGDGNLFIADTYNNRIRKIDKNSYISTVAGNGQEGYTGDGGPAKEAALNRPSSLAFDQKGNLLIVDAYNFRIRKVDPAGIISTVTGNGNCSLSSNDEGVPVALAVGCPMFTLAVDLSDNLYFDLGGTIRKADSVSGTISTVAGKNLPGSPLGDGGPAIEADISVVQDLAFNEHGDVFIADRQNHRIRRINCLAAIKTPEVGSIKEIQPFVHPSVPPQRMLTPKFLAPKKSLFLNERRSK